MPLKGDKIASVDTWQQWTDMAEFFTRKSGDMVAGEKLENPCTASPPRSSGI